MCCRLQIAFADHICNDLCYVTEGHVCSKSREVGLEVSRLRLDPVKSNAQPQKSYRWCAGVKGGGLDTGSEAESQCEGKGRRRRPVGTFEIVCGMEEGHGQEGVMKSC